VPTCSWVEKQLIRDFRKRCSVTGSCSKCPVLLQFSCGIILFLLVLRQVKRLVMLPMLSAQPGRWNFFY